MLIGLAGCGEEATRLPDPGVDVEGPLSSGETRAYETELEAGEYVNLLVEHRSIGLTLRLEGPTGRVLQQAAALPASSSVQMLSWISSREGRYRIEMRGIGPAKTQGSIVAAIDVRRPARAGDEERVAAERRYSEGFRLRLERSRESMRASIPKFEEALELWRRAGDPTGQARTLHTIGYVYLKLEEHAEALPRFEAALPLWRAARDAGGEADTLINLGVVCRRLGRQEDAVQHYRRALDTMGENGKRRVVLSNLAQIHTDLGELDQALACYRQAIGLCLEAEDPVGAAKVQVNLGYFYRDLQEHRRALDLFHSAIPVLRQAEADKFLAAALNNLGVAYGVLGQHRRATTYLEEALVINRRTDDTRNESRTLSNLGWSLHYQGEPRSALLYLEQTLELRKEASNDEATASVWHNAARSYHSVGEIAKALRYYERSLELKKVLGDERGIAVTLTEMAAIHLERGRYEESLRLIDEALELSGDVEDQRNQAVALLVRARVERRWGDPRAALAAVEEAIGIVESRRSKIGSALQRAAFLATKHRFYELWVELLMERHLAQPAAGFAGRALAASERGRARSLVDMIEGAQMEVRRRAGDELERHEQELLRKVHRLEIRRERAARRNGTAPEAERLEHQLIPALAELEQVQSKIYRSSPAYAALAEPKTLDVVDLRQQILDDDTVLMELALGEERSFLWVVKAAGLEVFVLPDRASVDAAARRVVDLLTARERAPEGETLAQRSARIQQADAAYPAAAAALSDMILLPAVAASRAHRWLVVTDGALSYVPFGALADPWREGEPAEGWQPLIRRHEIVRLPSASSLAALREQPRRERPARPLLVLADPVFDTQDPRLAELEIDGSPAPGEPDPRTAGGESVLRRLTFSSREAEAIAAHVPSADADVRLGFEAAKSLVTSPRLASYRVVHFATHGILDDRVPQLSALKLSMYDRDGRRVDGSLKLHDIYNLQLAADLVVLSACQTALGEEIRGEGLIGLTRGFMYAGVPRVLATLWTVQDRASMELMDRFYQGMLRDGERPAAAIRNAQLSLLERQHFSAPYYWAGFELQGEWR